MGLVDYSSGHVEHRPIQCRRGEWAGAYTTSSTRDPGSCSLIGGLLLGGSGGGVATMPVISTLDATACAAPQPDYHRVQFTIDAAGTITEVTPDSANCVPSVPPDTG
jgi:hypothetical protein